MASHNVQIGVIGGSGLYNMDGFQPVEDLSITTPWGKPSSDIKISLSPEGHRIAFLSRHGFGHNINPSEIPVRANIAALKSIGVKVIIAFSAIGSLQEIIKPGDFVLPSQIIDRTKGYRENTFFEKGVAAHAGFADPFSSSLAKLISKGAQSALANGATLHHDKTLVCIEGPTFSTRAESHLYRQWGCDVINMSAVPEAKLAREAEIAYQMICMSTDYDCWRESEEAVTVAAVMATMKQNAVNACNILTAALPNIELELEKPECQVLTEITGSMKFAVVTNPTAISGDVKERLSFIFPQYFK